VGAGGEELRGDHPGAQAAGNGAGQAQAVAVDADVEDYRHVIVAGATAGQSADGVAVKGDQLMPWQRTSSSARGYGAHWRKMREQALKRDRFLCQPCERKGFVTPASAVDHVVPKSKGGSDELENLQAICDECHEKKTIEESGGKRKPRIGLDGWPV